MLMAPWRSGDRHRSPRTVTLLFVTLLVVVGAGCDSEKPDPRAPTPILPPPGWVPKKTAPDTPPPGAPLAETPDADPSALEPDTEPAFTDLLQKQWREAGAGTLLSYRLKSASYSRDGDDVRRSGVLTVESVAVEGSTTRVLAIVMVDGHEPLHQAYLVSTDDAPVSRALDALDGEPEPYPVGNRPLVCHLQVDDRTEGDGPRIRRRYCRGDGIYLMGGLATYDYLARGMSGGGASSEVELTGVSLPGRADPDRVALAGGPTAQRVAWHRVGEDILTAALAELRRPSTPAAGDLEDEPGPAVEEDTGPGLSVLLAQRWKSKETGARLVYRLRQSAGSSRDRPRPSLEGTLTVEPVSVGARAIKVLATIRVGKRRPVRRLYRVLGSGVPKEDRLGSLRVDPEPFPVGDAALACRLDVVDKSELDGPKTTTRYCDGAGLQLVGGFTAYELSVSGRGGFSSTDVVLTESAPLKRVDRKRAKAASKLRARDVPWHRAGEDILAATLAELRRTPR